MKTILIVEDEAIMRDSLSDWLSDSGYNVQTASEGEEALRIIEERDFDMVVLDLRLPGKDGLQVLREARLKKPQLKGIIITAYPSVETAVEAMKVGAIDFLSKPIDLSKLQDLIQEKTRPFRPQAGPILIVDDELSMRESLKDWFADLGYAVETARDGEEALRLIGKKVYGLLTLDLKLPGKNGIEVLKEARKLVRGLRGIVITAYPSIETAVEAMRNGAIDYLSKPVALSELEKLVAASIEPMQVGIIERPLTRAGLSAMLKVLDRAAEDSPFLARLSESPEEALAEYPDLTEEEKEVLIDGDLRKIESWVGKLDQRRATWLWCRLSQEKW
jgi:DNA-binding NtrC family response regulator